MGREVRKVPANWQPPMSQRYPGTHQPHYDMDYKSACEEWKRGYEEWKTNPRMKDCEYWDYAGMPPDENYYRPAWTDEERTHFMMYENTSEGTPLSPPFATKEELARWLADTGASIFGHDTATYDEWMRIINADWVPDMIMANDTLQTGVAALDAITSSASPPPQDAT